MIFRIGLENSVEGRSLAWVLDHPGCFAYGTDGESALAAAPEAIRDYFRWIADHSRVHKLDPGDIDVQMEETWQVYTIDNAFDLAQEGYEVNAWFRHDWKPLNSEEIERGMELLGWTRSDLLESVERMSADDLDRTLPGERWSFSGILNHVAYAEWWYLDKLGLAYPHDDLPHDPFNRLEKVRTHMLEILPKLVGSKQVLGVYGEFWSPRKMLRRAIWHERDHTSHILKLRSMG